MKLINKFKSPNFDKRTSKKILYIIIHYTALKTNEEAISYLCDFTKKVSSHYLVSQKGEIYNLVDDTKRAWHAGFAYWDGYNDLNSISIGIELDFSNHKNNNKYSNRMMHSLIYLLRKIKNKYKIKDKNILGHSDIAPYRKIDPGPKFPWNKLYKFNLVSKPKKLNNVLKNIVNKWFLKNKILSNKKKSLFIFGYLGYDTKNIGINNPLFKKLIFAYQTHFIQKNITGRIDTITINFLINHFINNLLNKK